MFQLRVHATATAPACTGSTTRIRTPPISKRASAYGHSSRVFRFVCTRPAWRGVSRRLTRAGLPCSGPRTRRTSLDVEYVSAVCAADRGRIANLLARAVEGKSSEFEFEVVSSNDPGTIYSSCFIPLRDEVGETTRIIRYTIDVSDLRNQESSLRSRLRGCLARYRSSTMWRPSAGSPARCWRASDST